jgi:3-phytase
MNRFSEHNEGWAEKGASWGRVALVVLLAVVMGMACQTEQEMAGGSAGEPQADSASGSAIVPVLVTEPVGGDSDDPAIWLNPDDPSQSLILGTDKAGAVYTFNLEGKIIPDKTVTGMGRINNIDVAYGVMLGGVATDVAVATDRNANLLRAFRLPDMTPVDNGGAEAFEGEPPERRRPMGIALYTRPTDGALFAIVSRKTGPSGGYLWQYRIEDDGTGNLAFTKVRELGAFRGTKEIESVAVDDALGYVYYSEEDVGVHKYQADPDAPGADEELALFGTQGFKEDREGISIYEVDDGTGYILVSDQQANAFRVYPREGTPGDPHNHPEIYAFFVSTNESDGSEVTNATLGDRFPSGLFIAMSDNRTFHFYSWDDIAGDTLLKAPNGVAR